LPMVLPEVSHPDTNPDMNFILCSGNVIPGAKNR
jgi:hypothetical protein